VVTNKATKSLFVRADLSFRLKGGNLKGNSDFSSNLRGCPEIGAQETKNPAR